MQKKREIIQTSKGKRYIKNKNTKIVLLQEKKPEKISGFKIIQFCYIKSQSDFKICLSEVSSSLPIFSAILFSRSLLRDMFFS